MTLKASITIVFISILFLGIKTNNRGISNIEDNSKSFQENAIKTKTNSLDKTLHKELSSNLSLIMSERDESICKLILSGDKASYSKVRMIIGNGNVDNYLSLLIDTAFEMDISFQEIQRLESFLLKFKQDFMENAVL